MSIKIFVTGQIRLVPHPVSLAVLFCGGAKTGNRTK